MRSTERGWAGEIREVGSHRALAFLSAGADRKANAQGPVRGSYGLLKLLQRGVALETLGESESSLGAKVVGRDTASMGAQRRVLRRVNGR